MTQLETKRMMEMEDELSRESIWYSLSSQGSPKDQIETTSIQQFRREMHSESNPARPPRVRGETLIMYGGLGMHISQVGEKLMWAAEHNDSMTVERWILPRISGKVLFRVRLGLVGGVLISSVLFAGLYILDDAAENSFVPKQELVLPFVRPNESWIFTFVTISTVFSLIVTGLLCIINLAPFIEEPGPSPNFYINGEYTSLLHVAAAFGSCDVVETLLLNGASPDVTDLRLRTPLHYAAIHGRRKVCKMLIETGHASIHVRDDNDMYPHNVLRIGADISFKRLLGAPPTVLLDQIKRVLYDTDDTNDSVETVEILMQKNKLFLNNSTECTNVRDMLSTNIDSDIDLDDDDFGDNKVAKQKKLPMWGMTPLMLICQYNNFYSPTRWEMIVKDMIVEYGANVNKVHPTRGTTALHEAVRSNNKSMAILLINLGGNPLIPDFTRKRTPLHDACINGNNINLVRIMLEKITGLCDGKSDEDDGTRINFDLYDIDGTTPLQQAIVSLSSNPEMIQLLLYHGCDPMLPGKTGNSRIGSMYNSIGWLASKSNTLNMMKTILSSISESKSFDINALNPCGLSLLHIASRCGNLLIVQLLLEHQNININLKCNKSKKTAKEYAHANGHLNIVELLESSGSSNAGSIKAAQHVTENTQSFGIRSRKK